MWQLHHSNKHQAGSCCDTPHSLSQFVTWKLWLCCSWTLLFVDIKSLLYKNYIIGYQSWCESHSTLADLEAAFGKVTEWLIFGFKRLKQHLRGTLLTCLNLTTRCSGMANDFSPKKPFPSQVSFTDMWRATRLSRLSSCENK